jgi:hypothetical protein
VSKARISDEPALEHGRSHLHPAVFHRAHRAGKRAISCDSPEFTNRDRGCTLLGNFLRDTVYYYAENDRGAKWPADGANLPVVAQCIDHNKTFRATASMPSCPADQEPAKFRLLKIAPNQPRLTWTLTGGK